MRLKHDSKGEHTITSYALIKLKDIFKNRKISKNLARRQQMGDSYQKLMVFQTLQGWERFEAREKR